MDSRGKQRLTGAIILVALFVLLVPELLTGPRNASGDAPNEEGMRRYTIDLDAAAGSAQPMAPAAPAPAVSLPPVADNSPSSSGNIGDSGDTHAVPGESARPAAAPAVSVAAPVPAPSVVTPMSSPPPTVAANPAPATAPPKPVAAPPTLRVETAKPAQSTSSAQRGAFAVQLGSFVSKENAERLVHDMNAKGFNAFLAPPITTGGRELYRVRVGPTRDRASAEALATQLRRVGQSGSIVPIS
jgi:cell division septation protein DedD